MASVTNFTVPIDFGDQLAKPAVHWGGLYADALMRPHWQLGATYNRVLHTDACGIHEYLHTRVGFSVPTGVHES